MEAPNNPYGVKMWDYHKQSKPLPVEGGIKLKSKKKDLANTWWGNRWIEAIESFQDNARLSRGRSYARKGQVTDITISEGAVIATVQGSRSKPYRTKVEFQTLSSQAWDLVIKALAEKALYTARLLSGELPKEVEAIFNEIKIPLLPSHYEDFSTDCSCPDWSNPCKHIAAVLYLLGEEFGRDPFLLFKARGIEREAFLKRLEEHSFTSQSTLSTQKQENIPLSKESNFWSCKEVPPDWLANAFEKNVSGGTILKSLGKFPFWRGEVDLFSFLDPIYTQASHQAQEMINEQIEPQAQAIKEDP